LESKYLLITYDFPPAGGGISRYYHNIFRHFPSREIVVWSVRNAGEDDITEIDGIKIIRSKLKGSQIHNAPSLLHCSAELTRIIRSEKPTFLLCGNIRPFGPVTYLLARRFNIPFAVLTHGFDIARALMKMGRNPLYGLLHRKVLEESSWIVTNSSYTKNLIIGKFPSAKKRTEIVHPGVDTDQFVPSRRKWKDPMLLSVGRLTERKGVDEVIRSLPAVLKEYPRLTYNVVGDGDYRQTLDELAGELDLRDKVIFHYDVEDKELKSWYDRSDIFLMVTKPVRRAEDFEGFGIVYLEASASGLPVIASSLGGVSDAVVDNRTGLLVKPEPGEISRAILRLLGNKNLRDKLGKNGRERCVREFQWKYSSRKLRLLLQKAPAGD